jgi:translocation protein SEC63
MSHRSLFITFGWLAFGLLSYKVATTKIVNKIYDPFEILGIGMVSHGLSGARVLLSRSQYYHGRVLRKRRSNLTIKSFLKYCELPSLWFFYCVVHYSRSHPDKVKLTGNDTAESVAARFVDITKAYKAYALFHRNLCDLI